MRHWNNVQLLLNSLIFCRLPSVPEETEDTVDVPASSTQLHACAPGLLEQDASQGTLSMHNRLYLHSAKIKTMKTSSTLVA